MVFLSLQLYKVQTMTTLVENSRKIFRALCAVVLEMSKQTMVKKAARNKMAVRNKNGRKRAEKIFALYAPWSLR